MLPSGFSTSSCQSSVGRPSSPEEAMLPVVPAVRASPSSALPSYSPSMS